MAGSGKVKEVWFSDGDKIPSQDVLSKKHTLSVFQQALSKGRVTSLHNYCKRIRIILNLIQKTKTLLTHSLPYCYVRFSTRFAFKLRMHCVTDLNHTCPGGVGIAGRLHI